MNEKKTNNRNLYLIIIGMAVLIIVCFMKIHSLSGEIRNLRNEISNESNILRDEINAIYNNVDEQMKKQASLFTSSEFSVDELDMKTQTVPVTLKVVPKEVSDDTQMSVAFDGETVAFVKDGGIFQATIPVGLFIVEEPYPVITITSGGISKTEVLDEVYLGELWSKWLPILYAEDATGRAEYEDGKLSFDTEILIECKATDAEPKVAFETFTLVTELNGKEIESRDITSEVKSSEDYENGLATVGFEKSYDVAEGDSLSVYVVAEDSLGYIHKILARHWKRSNGAEAEAVYGGVSIYDKQGNMIYGF